MIQYESIPKAPGVYMIVNTANHMFYIGSTFNLRKRCKEHIRSAQAQSHFNKRFQKCWNESNPDDFEFVILEHLEKPAKWVLVEAEITWMKFYLIPDNPRALNSGLAKHKIESVWKGFNILFHCYKGVIVEKTVFKTVDGRRTCEIYTPNTLSASDVEYIKSMAVEA